MTQKGISSLIDVYYTVNIHISLAYLLPSPAYTQNIGKLCINLITK